MVHETNFFDYIQLNADESSLFLTAEIDSVHALEIIPYDEGNMDFQIEAVAGGWSGDVMYQNPDG